LFCVMEVSTMKTWLSSTFSLFGEVLSGEMESPNDSPCCFASWRWVQCRQAEIQFSWYCVNLDNFCKIHVFIDFGKWLGFYVLWNPPTGPSHGAEIAEQESWILGPVRYSTLVGGGFKRRLVLGCCWSTVGSLR